MKLLAKKAAVESKKMEESTSVVTLQDTKSLMYTRDSIQRKQQRNRDNSSTHFLRQLVDRSLDNSSTLDETTRRHFCSKLIDL